MTSDCLSERRSERKRGVKTRAHVEIQRIRKWWLEPESNRRHEDFQSSALPTELSSRTSKPRIQGKRMARCKSNFQITTLRVSICPKGFPPTPHAALQDCLHAPEDIPPYTASSICPPATDPRE